MQGDYDYDYDHDHEQTQQTFELEPKLTYNDTIEAIRVQAQGIDCTVTGEMLELCDAKGTITLSKDIPHRDVEVLFGANLDQDHRLSVTVEPIEELGEPTDE